MRPRAAGGSGGRRARVRGRPDLGGVPGHGLHRDGAGDLPRDREALRDALELLERHRPGRREAARRRRDPGARGDADRSRGVQAPVRLPGRPRARSGHRWRLRWRTRSDPDGSSGSRAGSPSTSSRGSRCSPTTACRWSRAFAPTTLEDAIAAAERHRVPGRGEDGGARRAAQVRCRRRSAGRGRLALARGRVCRSRTPARSAGHGRADGAAGGRDRARDRARSAVRPAGAGRRGRRAGRGAEGPTARDAAARASFERGRSSTGSRSVRCWTASGASRVRMSRYSRARSWPCRGSRTISATTSRRSTRTP